MSTEHLNNDMDSQAIDKEREVEILYFVESMDKQIQPTKTRHQSKWMAALHKRFSQRSLTLILTSCATVLILIATLVLGPWLKDSTAITGDPTQTPEGTVEETETENETNTITLLDKTQAADSAAKTYLKQVDIQNEDDSFTIRYDDTAKTYVLQNYEDITLSTDLLLTLRHYTETIEAIKEVEIPSTLDAYGLDNPLATASITYADGTTTQLHIGNKTPSNSGYYGQLEGMDGVYILDSNAAALFRHRSTAYVDTTLITAPTVKTGDENGQALLKEITYSGTAFPAPLVLRRSNHNDSEELSYFSYIITAPYLRCTSDEASSALGSLQSLSASQALYLHPTEEQKSKLGFNNPLIQIDAVMAVETEEESSSETTSDDEVVPKVYYNNINYKIIVGSLDENGNYIAMLEGVDAIFLIDKASYGFLLDRTYQNSVNVYLFFKHIKSLDRISVEFGDEKHEFQLTHYPEKEDLNEQLKITENGKALSTEEFRELYELIMALERHGVPDAEPTGNVALTLSLYDTDGNLYLSADYYETSASVCTVTTSQGEVLTTLWSDVAFFIQQVKNYAEGKNVLIKN